MEKVKIDDKYDIIVDLHNGGSIFEALRYGESWRNLIGDNLILAMTYKIQELQERLSNYDNLLQIIDRAKKLAYLAEEEENKPRFRMDANGNLSRVEED